jgi:hypothetical protein
MIFAPSTVVGTQEFRDANGTLFDPALITCTVTPPPVGTPPTSTPITYTFALDAEMGHPAVGVYTCTYDMTLAGAWLETWYGSNAFGQVTHKRTTEAT